MQRRPDRNWLAWWLAVLILCLGPALHAVKTARINGIDYVSLSEVGGSLGMEAQWLKRGERLRLKSQWTTMEYTINRRDFTLNGTAINLGWPIAPSKGDLYMSEVDYEKTLQPVLTPQVFKDVPKLYRIVIDPGHGGKDPGAQNTGLKLNEKDAVLDVAKRLQKLLAAQGYDVVLTRDSDVYLPLSTRSSKANDAGADLFISLHFNAVGSSSVQGMETYVFTAQNMPSSSRGSLHSSDRRTYAGNRSDTWNMLAGYYVQRAMTEKTKATDRGVKRARFTVLRDLNMPGMLIEGGFVTSSREGPKIASASYRQDLAEAIADGVITYQRTLNRLRGR
ncbi:MAG: N-acetylmuramoyl-L-alanine amidase [Verrucomicrobiota bacterium JB022]|nr:N-acetylmuramoyl-L-alanine amidase [Verrucomicrobiota bacterium JB022]